MIKAVIFDLDDTLISEHEYVKSGFNVIAKYVSANYQLSSQEVYQQLLNLFLEDTKKVFNRLLDFYKIEYTIKEIQELIKIYREHIPTISLYEDAESILCDLSNSNLKLGMITDGYQITQRNKLKSLNINHYFELIIVTDELGREFWKPHAKSYELMKEQLKLEFDEMIYVGDNLSKDFITAKKLGMKTIHIERHNGVYKNLYFEPEYQAHHKITSLNQLKQII